MRQETDAEKIARREQQNQQLPQEIERRKQHIQRWERAVEEALRAGKREAAPFSHRTPKANPQTPGRKAGACDGRSASRVVLPEFEETLEGALPDPCPHGGGAVEESGQLVEQEQSEIPEPQVEPIRFHRAEVLRQRPPFWEPTSPDS